MIAGIIAEYNPFHKGHLYQINEIRRLYNPEAIIVVMSGCFTQRGEPAIADKYTRAWIAAKNGADLVIELPFVYACSNAGTFADGGIRLLNSLNIVDTLFFGAECADTAMFDKISSVLSDEPDDYKQLLKENMKNGLSYPKARSMALSSLMNTEKSSIESFMTGSNNNLGIEYCVSLKRNKSYIKPCPITRKSADHNDTTVYDDITSAISIRQAIYNSTDTMYYYNKLLDFDILNCNNYINKPITPELLTPYINSVLISKTCSTTSDIADSSDNYRDISVQLLNKIKKLETPLSREEIINALKTKDITYTSVSRALLNLIFGLTEEEFTEIDSKYPRYANILAFNNIGTNILNIIRQKSDIKLITKKADYRPDSNKEMLCRDYDIKATAFYNMLRYTSGHDKNLIRSEYRSSVAITS